MPTSRNPAVPVNLTTSTPVGPQARTLASVQDIDRVERLRYHRRSDGLIIPAVAYDQRLANNAESGYETYNNSSWNNTPAGTRYGYLQIGLPFIVSDWLAGFCFPATGSVQGAECSLAQLTLTVTEHLGSSGNGFVYAERNLTGPSSLYSGTNYPSDHWDAGEYTSASTQLLSGTGDVTWDVTQQVNDVLASAFYSGGYINFLVYASEPVFEGFAPSGAVVVATRPRLVITP